MLQLPLQAGAKSSETGESRTGSTREGEWIRGTSHKQQENVLPPTFPMVQVKEGAEGLSPNPTAAAAGGQWLGYSQVVVSVGAALLLPPVDDDDGDGHADDEDGGDDASHDPNDASGGTLR